MERGIKLGAIVGVLAVIVGLLESVVFGGSVGYLRFVLSNPTGLVRSLVWNAAIFAILGALYERSRASRQTGSAGDGGPTGGFDSEMSGFDE